MTVPFPVRAFPNLTLRAWSTPPALGRATAAKDRDEIGDLDRCHFGGRPGFEAGEGPLVLAVHGWGGRTAQMAPIARRLAVAGFRVVAPTLPGVAGGPMTDIKQAAAALRDVVDDIGEPVALIGHSFAAMVFRLAFAETGAAPGRVALVAPALDVDDALDVFGERLGLFPWARVGLRRRLQRWDPTLWPLLTGIHPNQLEGADLLIVHDPEDMDTPFMRSAELASRRPDTSLVPISGGGHSRILSQPKVLDTIADFVAGLPVAGRSAA